METKFKVGDLAWSARDGFQILTQNHYTDCLLEHGYSAYTTDGYRCTDDAGPTLLTTSEAALLGYVPPKKKVEKTIELYLVKSEYGIRTMFYERPDAESFLGGPYTITYEVEE